MKGNQIIGLILIIIGLVLFINILGGLSKHGNVWPVIWVLVFAFIGWQLMMRGGRMVESRTEEYYEPYFM